MHTLRALFYYDNNINMTEQKCKKCQYQWFSRVEKPKACPACKNYIKSVGKKK